MSLPRDDFGAIRLPNGNVLVAGGNTASGPTASSELYHPSTGTWTSTGSLHVARAEFTVVPVRTSSGRFRVLAVGGATSTGVTATAELYDPSTHAWHLTGSMHSARFDAPTIAIGKRRALVAGGSDGTAALATAEVYRMSTHTWKLVGSMPQAMFEGGVAKLRGGDVLVAGGVSAPDTPVSAAQIYDRDEGVWVTAASMATAREGLDLTTLQNGDVLADGGLPVSPNATASAELFTP
jgi:uncharacterized protein GlcG (DUF336 family)